MWFPVKTNRPTNAIIRRLHDDYDMPARDIAGAFGLPVSQTIQAIHAGRLDWSLEGHDVDWDDPENPVPMGESDDGRKPEVP